MRFPSRQPASAAAIVVLLIAAACRTAAPVAGMPHNFGVVEDGKIYRGGQPSASGLEALKRIGVRTIVKVSAKDIDMERTATSRLGMKLVEVPLHARTVGTSKACADVSRAYTAITDPSNWPVYVHCDHGRDRTGFLAGLYRERAEGWKFEQVSDELTKYGHGTAMRIVLPNISNALADGDRACATAR
ncbi:MAG: fused DSP-PTPase phosphatase/NAD kinase-like protein [Thermoanaerobaculia bacterium]